MMTLKIKSSFIVLIAILFYSCGNSKATKIAEAQKAALIVKQIQGEELYENHCERCHKLYDPEEYTMLEWQSILKKMQNKAHLEDVDVDKILIYLNKSSINQPK